MAQREGLEEESDGFKGHFRFMLGNVRCQKTNSLIFSLFLLLQGIHALEISLLCSKKRALSATESCIKILMKRMIALYTRS